MGVCRTEKVGCNYESLFHAADQALYAVKRSGRGSFQFFDQTMQDMQDKLSVSAISPIDSEGAQEAGHKKGE